MTMSAASSRSSRSCVTGGTRRETFRAFADARAYLAQAQPAAVIVDVRLGNYNGLQLIHFSQPNSPGTQWLVVSGFDDPVLRQEATKLGAHFLTKPLDLAASPRAAAADGRLAAGLGSGGFGAQPPQIRLPAARHRQNQELGHLVRVSGEQRRLDRRQPRAGRLDDDLALVGRLDRALPSVAANAWAAGRSRRPPGAVRAAAAPGPRRPTRRAPSLRTGRRRCQ